MEEIRLDEKDRRIIRELDINYKTPFTQIAKKVRLSKNAVIQRYEKKNKNTH